ncbi:hypothetical protein EVAR_24752_1 [Eumeta japonica]|uniref:Uncharacterized protein n=1 Tax=Eumeta variegata TaxID=151549 RepID=A0A4C1VDS7_EUMVA|nr:hypothetical protein EVAR_24752_1 [Eumeta japonica]
MHKLILISEEILSEFRPRRRRQDLGMAKLGASVAGLIANLRAPPRKAFALRPRRAPLCSAGALLSPRSRTERVRRSSLTRSFFCPVLLIRDYFLAGRARRPRAEGREGGEGPRRRHQKASLLPYLSRRGPIKGALVMPGVMRRALPTRRRRGDGPGFLRSVLSEVPRKLKYRPKLPTKLAPAN